MTSKCGKNKKVAHEAQPSVSLMFLPHFDVLCDLLLNRRTATWNLFVLYNKEFKKVLMMTSSIRLFSSRSYCENQSECVHNSAYYIIHPAAAKTIHRSQGDTETKINVNFNTTKTIPHVHYVGPIRVATFEGLYITDLCEDKIVVHPDVKIEMERLRTIAKLKLCISPL